MDEREMLQRHLALAETHVVKGEQHIANQKKILANLEGDGHERALQQAKELLVTFEMTQASHVGDRDRIKAELAELK